MTVWPDARLDPVRRLHVLATGVSTRAIVERELPVPFERLWAYLADLEHSVPEFDDNVGSLRVHHRTPLGGGAELLEASATMWARAPQVRFDIRMEPGFCWMVQRQRIYVVGMAATPIDDTRVRYAHLEGIPRRGSGILRRWLARHVDHDVAGIARALRAG
jgi:hypothetical protein